MSTTIDYSPHRYDPFAPEVAADPYPWYRALRDRAPVHYVEADNLYVVSRYDDVLSVLRQPRLFSSELGMGALMRGEASPRLARPRSGSIDVAALRVLIATDPPDHTTLRRIVSRPFTPRAIGELEPRVRDLAHSCVSELLAANDAGDADLVRHVAEPLPVLVIAEMLGIPPERRNDFKRWSDDVVGVLSGNADLERGQASMLEMFEFFTQAATERQRAPRNDLISLLVTGSEDGALSPTEIVVFCVLLLIAGNETTTNLLANWARAMFARPDLDVALRHHRELIPSAVEETLRYDGPVQALFRETREATSLANVDLPAHARVLILFGSANRDERHFPNPDEFRLDREPRDHVGFGAGIHLCLGAALARLEARVAIETLYARATTIGPRAEPEMIDSFILRGARRVPVQLA